MNFLKKIVLAWLSLCVFLGAPPKGKGKKNKGAFAARVHAGEDLDELLAAQAQADARCASGDGGAGSARRCCGGAGSSSTAEVLPPQARKLISAKPNDFLFFDEENIKRYKSYADAKATALCSVVRDEGDRESVARQNRMMSLRYSKDTMNRTHNSLQKLLQPLRETEASALSKRIELEWAGLRKTFEIKSNDFKNPLTLSRRFMKQLDFIYAFKYVFQYHARAKSAEFKEAAIVFDSLIALFHKFLGIDSLAPFLEIQDFMNKKTASIRGDVERLSDVTEYEVVAVRDAGNLASCLEWDIRALSARHRALDLAKYPERVSLELLTLLDIGSEVTLEKLQSFFVPLGQALGLRVTPENAVHVVQQKMAESLCCTVFETLVFLHNQRREGNEHVGGCLRLYLEHVFENFSFTHAGFGDLYKVQVNKLKDLLATPGHALYPADLQFYMDACMSSEMSRMALYTIISRVPFLPEVDELVLSAEYIQAVAVIKTYLAFLKKQSKPFLMPMDIVRDLRSGKKPSRSVFKQQESSCPLVSSGGIFVSPGRVAHDASLASVESAKSLRCGVKPAWLIKVEQFCDSMPRQLCELNYSFEVYSYLYPMNEESAAAKEAALVGIFTRYKELADRNEADLSLGCGAGAGAVDSTERLMTLISCCKRVLFAYPGSLSIERKLELLNGVFGSSLTSRGYRHMNVWFNSHVFSREATGGAGADDEDDLGSFLGGFPDLRALFAESRAAGSGADLVA